MLKTAPLPPITHNDDDAQAARQEPGSADDSGASFSVKLSNVEAQRIMAVLQEAQQKVRLLGLLPETLDRKTSTMFSPEALVLMQEQKQAQERYRLFFENRKGEEQSADAKEVAKQLRSSTRNICRYFMQTPGAMAKLSYLKTAKPPVSSQFEHLLQEVKMLVYERLRTSVEEEKARQDQLSSIIAKERKTSNEVKAIKDELDKAKKERATEVNKRNEVIRRLKEELRDIKQAAEETTKRMESRSKQKEDQEMQQFREKEAAMKVEIATLLLQLDELTSRNREEEANSRKKKFKIESEVENWIHKYDSDMDEKQNELEDLTTIYLEEKSQLDELQQRYGDLQREYERIMEERRQLQEQKKLQETQLRRMNDAATLIQAIFRGYRVRKEIAKKKAAVAKPQKKKK